MKKPSMMEPSHSSSDLEVIERFRIVGHLVKDAAITKFPDGGTALNLLLIRPRDAYEARPDDGLRVMLDVKSSVARDVCNGLKRGKTVFVEGTLFCLTRPDAHQGTNTKEDIWLAADRWRYMGRPTDMVREVGLERE
jgi:hypothetical protein